MYPFKLVHHGILVTTRASQFQGIGVQFQPGSTQFFPLVSIMAQVHGWHSLSSVGNDYQSERAADVGWFLFDLVSADCHSNGAKQRA